MPFVPDEVAKEYFEARFFDRVTSDRGAKKRKKPLSILPALEQRYGFGFPGELKRLVTLAETYDLSGVCAGEWQHMSDALAPFKEGKNLFVQAVELDQKHYLGTALLELLCSLVPIGHARNGDVYLAFVDSAESERCEVFLWDHEERTLSAFADSISSLAYLSYLYEIDRGEVEVEGDVLEALKAGLSRLEKRVSPSWHYESLSEKTGATPAYEPSSHAVWLHYRALWALTLVSGGGAEAAAEAKAFIGDQLEAWHRDASFVEVLANARFKRSPLAVYWLFYTYFFDQPEQLARAVSELATSESLFARDAAAFFAELAGASEKRTKAKVKLGKITDVAALKKKFLKAETGAARARREQEERARAEAARAPLLAEADAIARGATAEAIEAAARQRGASPVIVERLFEHLRELDPEVARSMKRLAVLADSQRYREHKLVNTWFAIHGTRRLLPLLAARGLEHQAPLLEPPTDEEPPTPPETREAFGTLRTKTSREHLFKVARSGTAAHLAILDGLLERRRGTSVYVAFERVMREALASRVGAPGGVDLDTVRRGLRITYSERERTSMLHQTALRALAARAPADEVRATALRLMTWDLADVRQLARKILVALGETDRTRIIDRVEAEEVLERDGVEGLRALLRDPWAYPKSQAILLATEKGLGAEIASDAIASFKATYGPFEEGHGYYSGNYHVMLTTARAIADIEGPEVDAFIFWLTTSKSPLLSPALDDARTKERARGAGPVEQSWDEGSLEVASFSAPPFMLGGTIHGLAIAAGRLIAGGNGSSAFFDEAGRATPLPAEVRVGRAYDVDLDPSGSRFAIGYHACHLVVLDVATGAIVTRLQLGGVPSGIRKVKWSPSGRFIATASDDQSIRVVDLSVNAQIMRHDEPYDVNGIAWLDEDRLAFITDQHVGVLPRAGGEPTRIAGGGADVVVSDGKLVATMNKQGLAWIDPGKMKTTRKLAAKGVSRVRVSADGKVAWAAVYEGESLGLVRWTLADGASHQVISGEALYALALDPKTGDVVCGGTRGCVHRVKADGERIAQATNTHAGSVESLVAARGGGVLALDATSRVLSWSLSKHTAVAPWHCGAIGFSPHTVLETNDGVVVSAMKVTALYGPEGKRLEGKRWSVDTERCEAALYLGGQIIVGDGNSLHWLDAAAGRSLAKVPAGVRSTWIHYLFAVDDDAFLVAGYDEPKLARWSARERVMKHSALFDRRHEDDRFARPYGMTMAGRSSRLYAAAWNETVDVIDPTSLEVDRTYDVDCPYAELAVDEGERWLVAATGSFVDLVDLRDGRRVGRRIAPAEVRSLLVVDVGVALAGLASGEIMKITWSA